MRRARAPKRSKSPLIEVFWLVILVGSVFLGLSILDYRYPEDLPEGAPSTGITGRVGQSIAEQVMLFTFGRWGSLVVPVLMLSWLLRGRMKLRFPAGRVNLSILFSGFLGGLGVALGRRVMGLVDDALRSGALPLLAVDITTDALSLTGATLLWIGVALAGGVLLFGWSPFNLFEKLSAPSSKSLTEREQPWPSQVPGPATLPSQTSNLTPPILRSEKRAPEEATRPQDRKSPPPVYDTGTLHSLESGLFQWQYPPLELLNPPSSSRVSVDRDELEENARRLEEKLFSLGITARVVKMNPGPVITRYDLEPSAEVKLSRIVSLADDLAMALRAPGVRILAPIPGEAAVGVEIPNRFPQTVYISEVLGSEDFLNHSSLLAVALGKDAWGVPFVADLTRMPHLLIAGATGSGKSVCLNAILLSLLYRTHPYQLRLLLIDPKRIELSLYSALFRHHLITPPGVDERVITEPENAVAALSSVHREMERRYEILAQAGVRSLEEYHRWVEKNGSSVSGEEIWERLPYLVVVIDEMADLMLTARREFEDMVVRLAQMSRAVGIHLVVATQRPSVDIITGLIKANFPARIAFQMASRADSRTILDGNGAEALLGKGDMLYIGPGSRGLQRLHGALVTTEEVEKVVKFIADLPPVGGEFQLPPPDWSKLREGGGKGGMRSESLEDKDELFNEAAKIVVALEQGSVSILQRRLRIGYARAARLIDQLEQAGIVGPFDGSKARQVLMTPQELREKFGIE